MDEKTIVVPCMQVETVGDGSFHLDVIAGLELADRARRQRIELAIVAAQRRTLGPFLRQRPGHRDRAGRRDDAERFGSHA